MKYSYKNSKFTILIFAVLFSVGLPLFSYALPDASGGNKDVTGSNNPPPETLTNPLKVNSIAGLVQTGLEIFSYLVVIFAVLALIWVGFRFILARGNPEEMKLLKGWLMWIVVGVAVVIGANILVRIIVNTLGATGTVDQTIIQSAYNALQRK